MAAAFHDVPMPMILLDRKRCVRRINSAAQAMVRRAEKDTIGLQGGEALRCVHVFDAPEGCGFGPECRSCVLCDVVLETFETHQSHHAVEALIPYSAESGVTPTWALVSTAFLDLFGEELVLLCMEDITDRKRAELALKRSESKLSLLNLELEKRIETRTAELRESEERFRTLFEENPDGCFLMSLDGRFLDGNKAAENMIGRRREELIGVNMLESGLLPDSIHALAADQLARQAGGEQVEPTELKLQHKDGSEILAEVTSTPIRIHGQPAILGSARNLTLRRQAEAERERLGHQLQRTQKLESLGLLAGGIAHDFNNIMQGILMFSELLLGKLEAQSRQYRHALEIKKAVKQGATLTHQLLMFSREQPVNCEPLDLNGIIVNIREMLSALLSSKMRLVLKPSPHLNRIYADKGQLSQILINLAVNARDAMPEGGELTISTENVQIHPSDPAASPEARPGEFVCLSLADTGYGMTAHVKAHLFEPFFTTKDEHKGTGLGLSVVYGLVTEHGGWIHVDSKEKQGTVFKLYFPVYKRKPKPAEPIDTPAPTRKKHVLLVEDCPDVRQMITHLLQSAGYQVSAAESAEEAFELFDADPQAFSLLLSDIVLPKRNGIELANELRKKDPTLPVLFCSGYQNQRDGWGTLDLEGCIFLPKPINITSLLLAIDETLHSHAPKRKDSDHAK